MLSRNFRLQRVGDTKWLKKTYDFSKIAFAIDELIILNVEKEDKQIDKFAESLKEIVDTCFIPVSAGGGIDSFEKAEKLLSSGADKIVLNTSLVKDPELVNGLVKKYGSQCIIASVDFKIESNLLTVFISNGQEKLNLNLEEHLLNLRSLGVGEIYLNSIDQDGTGHGFCIEPLKELIRAIDIPVILSGGAGKAQHFIDAFKQMNIDAVSTANLFNFIGEGFPQSRDLMMKSGVELAFWNREDEKSLYGYFNV